MQIVVILFLTACIHASETFNYAVRLAGIRVSKLAVALSLNTIIALVSRTSNLVQSPLTGNLVDSAKMNPHHNSLFYELQVVLSGATIGTIIAIIFFPTMVVFGMNMISNFGATGSIFKMAISTLKLDNLKQITFRFPSRKSLQLSKILEYKNLIVINIIITGVYTVGVLSAQYASYLVPEYSTMAASSAGLINGIAMILMAVFIDPKIALMSDNVMSGKTAQSEINTVYGLMIISRLIGTVLAQFLLFPAASLIAFACRTVSGFLN